MKKRIALFLSLVFILSMIAGCAKTDSVKSTTGSDRFYYIDGGTFEFGHDTILVDRTTKVMYLFHKKYNAGGLTLLVDAEGKPLIYDGNFEGEVNS